MCVLCALFWLTGHVAVRKNIIISVVIKYLRGRYFRPLCQQKANEPENPPPRPPRLHPPALPHSTPSPKTPCVKHAYRVMIMDKCEKRRGGQEDIPEAPLTPSSSAPPPHPTHPHGFSSPVRVLWLDSVSAPWLTSRCETSQSRLSLAGSAPASSRRTREPAAKNGLSVLAVTCASFTSC